MRGAYAQADPRQALVEEFTDALNERHWADVEWYLGELFPEPDFASDGRRVACWLATEVRQTKGRFSQVPLVIEPWQYEFVCELYRLDPATGQRVYQEAMLLLPRKNGKSTLAAGLGLYHLCADFEASPEVYVAAGSKDQARIIFKQAKDTVNASPALIDYLKPWQNHIAHPESAGVFKVLASDFRLQHGSNPSANLIDEKWAHKSQDLTTALTSGTGAREEPLTVSISTVGHDLDSPLGEDFANALRVAPDEDDADPALWERCGVETGLETRDDGFITIARDLENGYLAWCYGPPFDIDALLAGRGFHPTVDLEDPAVWRRCNPASWVDERYLKRQRKKPSVRLADFRRFHINAWTESEDLWLPDGAWLKIKRAGARLVPGLPVWIGLDLGLTRDRAAIVVLQPTGEFVESEWDEDAWSGEDASEVVQRPVVLAEALIFEPPGDGRQLDLGEIRAALRELRRTYDVREVAYDPWAMPETGQTLEDEGFPMTAFDQQNSNMCPASQRLYDAICSARIIHDGDRDFAAHVNAGAITDCGDRGWRLTKRKARRPTDALMALAFALARLDADESNQSVYEDREVLVLDS